MSMPPPDVKRQVVPRWRISASSGRQGENASLLQEGTPLVVPEAEAQSLILDWLREPTLPHAGDAISLAPFIGPTPEIKNIAEFVVASRDAPGPLHSLARAILEQPDAPLAQVTGEVDSARRMAAALKRAVRCDPRDAIAYVDLSYAYSLLGQPRMAERAIGQALSLSTSRFVVRSASRLYLHTGHFDRAVEVLRRAPTLRGDPWLLAAEIAISEVAGLKSKNAKLAFRMLAEGRFSLRSTSELAAALGTLESATGAAKAARKLIQVSLKDPTENAVAQAEWLSRNGNAIGVLPSQFLEVMGTFEARTRAANHAGEWKQALAAGKAWIADEPYSLRSSILTAYIAANGLDDHAEAVRILQAARHANPNDAMALNNLAFSQASLGSLTEAESNLTAAFRSMAGDSRLASTLTATKGLLAIRRGRHAEGRELYESAVAGFQRDNDARGAAIAALMLALEDVRSNSEHATLSVARAEDLAGKVKLADVAALRDRVLKARTAQQKNAALT